MVFTARELVGRALARWILTGLDVSNDFAREGLPACDLATFLEALRDPAFPSEAFSIALVAFGVDDVGLGALVAASGLRGVRAVTTDLHVATAWRNDRMHHPRIIALASGYNPSVHGLRFFPRATSSELAVLLLDWAKAQGGFTSTPKHRELLENLRDRPGLASLRSLDGIAAFLEAWSRFAPGSIDAPREALPSLGLLPDPRLFEARDQGAELERNLQIGELLTILSPGEMRQRRRRAERYRDADTRAAILAALDRLEAHRRGIGRSHLTLEEASLLVRLPPDRADAQHLDDPDAIPSVLSDAAEPQDRGRELSGEAVDALLDGREDDLAAIGTALEAAWQDFDESGDTLAATARIGDGQVDFEEVVDVNVLDWVMAFCAADRFGGLIRTDVVDLRQALARYADGDPVFIDVEAIWQRDGHMRSVRDLLAAWDQVGAISEASERPLVESWDRFLEIRARLADPGTLRPLIVHPREWLDTHEEVVELCRVYLAVATELYNAVQRHYRTVWEESREWAQATLDALLSLDIVQVSIARPDGGAGAKAVMLPLHPLHLWRYLRLSEILRDLARGGPLPESDRAVLIKELKRPEHFIGVIRTGATPAAKGLNQLLPLANEIAGLATFENFHNAVSSIDGVETLVLALDHYVLLHPNHARPLRIALVNPPEPSRLLERIARLLDERRNGADRFASIEVSVFATSAHRDRLIAAATLEGRSQDLVYEKVAAGRLDLRVLMEPIEDLAHLVDGPLSRRVFHVAALFDESTISVRRRRVERFLPMSPFCIRNEIVVDRLLGEVSLSPHPGEAPFSDFVLMIHELEQEQRDSTMVASADADMLRAVVDRMLLGDPPIARWVMIADRALPTEVGMRAVRLLERKDGHRKVLLASSDYGRLAVLMRDAFDTCNLTVTDEALGGILRQGVNLVGAGLLDMIKKSSGQADTSKVVGFVGMLLAARDVLRDDPSALVASIDGVVARLWLRLGAVRASERCDLLVLRRAPDGAFRLTCLEVKTTLDPALPDEAERVAKAVAQIQATASVLDDAVTGQGPFSAPRCEMLKEVLVRAASNRSGDDVADAGNRRRWGPWLQDLFSGDGSGPPVRLDGEVVVVKLRSSEASRRAPWVGHGAFPIMIRHITEPLAEDLVAVRRPSPPTDAVSEPVRPSRSPVLPDGTPRLDRRMSPSVPRAAANPTVGSPAEIASEPFPAGPHIGTPHLDPQVPSAPRSFDELWSGDAPPSWPPTINALGMIGQDEVARELDNQARKARGWNQRFPDKLFVGPPGVGKTTLARSIAERLLGLTPIVFNGADLRRSEMIVDRLAEAGMVPGQAQGTIDVAPCLIFIDEVHAIASSVATVLLSALDDRRSTTVGNVTYGFGSVVFLLATTDPGRLTEAFLSRPDRTTLRSYTLQELAGIVWLHAKEKLDGAALSRATCIEIAARMQCSPRGSVNVLEVLTSSFYGTAESALGRVPTRADVAARMTVEAVADWFSSTLGFDFNGLGPLHMDYLRLLRSRGATSEDEVRRGLAISNKGDFVEVSEYLTRLGLIRTGPGGRSLTPDGRRYLGATGAMDLRERISRRNA